MASLPTEHAEKSGNDVGSIVLSSPPENGSASLSSDDDIAAAFVLDHAQLIEPRLERQVLRKIDLYLIPFMWMGYGFVYYDKVRQN